MSHALLRRAGRWVRLKATVYPDRGARSGPPPHLGRAGEARRWLDLAESVRKAHFDGFRKSPAIPPGYFASDFIETEVYRRQARALVGGHDVGGTRP